MSLYKWQVFVTVTEQKSFVKASNLLNTSQSAVSHIIAKLEDECGYRLFIRNRNNIDLTSNGKQLLPYVRQLLLCLDSLEQEINDRRNLQKGEVRIGAFNSATLAWLPNIITDFHKKYPQIKVIVRQTGDKNIRNMIENGEIDLAFISKDAVDQRTMFIPLHKTPLVCLTPRDYVPLNGTTITTADLKDKPLILQSEGYDTEMIKYLMEDGLSLDSDYRIEVDETCHAYVESGFGFCITSKLTADCNPRDVRIWQVEPKRERVIGLVTVYSDFISPSSELFREEILRYMTDKKLINV